MCTRWILSRFIAIPTFGKVAANHALGDIYAMGPSAIAPRSSPSRGLEAKQEDLLFR